MSKDTGGPAFPDQMHEGMTLRDYFAAKALMGLCSAHTSSGEWAHGGDRTAVVAYQMADAMLAERNK